MKKFVAIIGCGNSGKSTIIRSLTGCNTKGFRGLIRDGVSGNSVFVIASSPQEQVMTQEMGDILNQVLADNQCSGIVIAMQPNYRHRRNRTTMIEIFELVRNVGNFQIFAYVLDPGRSGQNIGLDIQRQLANFNLQIHTLDARRFSYFNANIIQVTSGILQF